MTDIERFLDRSRTLPLSYGPIGIVKHASDVHRVDEQVVAIGHGEADCDRARIALAGWKQFDIGWVETFPKHAAIEAGTVVAVLIRHLGFWSLNGARLLYRVGGRDDQVTFGFAYGTLTNHAESGEELFEVLLDRPAATFCTGFAPCHRLRAPWHGLANQSFASSRGTSAVILRLQ